ncbi:MAG: DoxX family protein [Woeseiaceae bacterium]
MNRQTDTAALVLRIALGTMFLSHGLLKLLVFTLPGTVGFFEQVGFPGWTAYVVTFAELGAGVLLLAGIGVRAVAVAGLPILLGATFVHSGNGWVFSNPNGGWEYPAFLAVVSVVQALLGPGRFAVRLPARQGETAAPQAATSTV